MGLFHLLFLILAIISFVAVMLLVIKIRDQNACPGDSELRQVVLYRKDINDPKADRIISHLGICTKCQKRIDEMNGM